MIAKPHSSAAYILATSMDKQDLRMELRTISLTLFGVGFFALAGGIAYDSCPLVVGAVALVFAAACFDHASERVIR